MFAQILSSSVIFGTNGLIRSTEWLITYLKMWVIATFQKIPIHLIAQIFHRQLSYQIILQLPNSGFRISYYFYESHFANLNLVFRV